MPKIKKQQQLSNYWLPPTKKQVEFRLLCKSFTIGGLIGSNGDIIKSLELSTSSNIFADVPTPSVKHRVVHIIASHSPTRTLTLDGVTVTVSPAQEALIRVYERLLESEEEAKEYYGDGDRDGNGVEKYVKCSVVVAKGMAGAVMGEGGSRINEVVDLTKAYVRILPIQFPPSGTEIDDEIVQVTGRSLSVKKALVMISQYLQQKAMDIAQGVPEATSSRFLNQSMKMDTNNAEVVFKMLCDYKAAGWVIGSKGKTVRCIEYDTGASIRFPPVDAGSLDRLVTISAFENKESQNSLAQNATVRIFDEIAKSEGNTVTARLLILPYQSDWLSDGDVSIISTIHKASGATLKIKELNHSVIGATADEKVLQIDGDYPDVQIALFQVTWELRERIFGVSLPKDSMPLLPHKLFNLPSKGKKISALTNKINKCSVSKEANGPSPPINPNSQCSTGSSLTSRSASSAGSATANGNSSVFSSNKTFVVTNKTLEIAVHEDVFAAVYGENSSNLSRLRMISGATVEVQDPIPGSDGKVIISGTSEQTLVAQSLLQAFLMSA